jgi:transposase InsO family protein
VLPTGGSGLAIVDGFTRECLALIADTSLPDLREVREFDFLIAVRGYPAMCVSDNGTEFTSMAILRGFAGSASPTVDWIARQITEAFPWNEAPHYLIRDRDQVYGAAATRRLRAMGIRDKPIAPRSPWQNGFAERLIGSIRRECVDHIVVLGEKHLRRVLKSYARYYNEMRTHRSLDKDAPLSRPLQRTGSIMSHALLGGLHHHYVRV